MKRSPLYFTALMSLTVPFMSASAAEEEMRIDRTSRAFKEAESNLRESTAVYQQISEGKMGKVPQSVLDKTKCVAIFPKTVTVSAGLGGTHGDGVGFCKSASGTWENPMFLNLTGGSIGVQAGVKSADIVLYLTGDRAADALRRGNFKVGGELSAVAGTFDKTFEAPQAEVIGYQRSEGLFLGASIDGINVSRDDSDERAFYGSREANLTARMPSDLEKEVNQLRNALPPHIG
jgi:lipid-binding SYLF domain-containing protein